VEPAIVPRLMRNGTRFVRLRGARLISMLEQYR